MRLSELIIDKIKKDGAVSFHDFMEMALYHPGAGYYTSDRNKIGWNGDYYTSPDLTPAFGAMIARQLEEMWRLSGSGEFTIVEYGAGTGNLCDDILGCIKMREKFYDKVNYFIIEKSPEMRKAEQEHLHEKVSWYDSLSDMPQITGCILSNEVADNFSVHRVVMKDELMEIFVDYKNGFTEILEPANDELKNYFSELKVTLPKNFCTEINLEAKAWIKDMACHLAKGYIITIDYGYPSSDLYNERRRLGTVMCYNHHSINDCAYYHIGEQDITSHVNFSALNYWGLKNGLQCCGFTNLNNFLRALGFTAYIRETEQSIIDNSERAIKTIRMIHTLLLDMGNKYKVLIQQKGLPMKLLTGMQLAQSIE